MGEESKETKTPTWQYIAGLAMSGMMFLSCLLLVTALSSIKANTEAIVAMDLRLTSAEKTVPLQFELIQQSLETIRTAQIAQATMLSKSEVTLKGWKAR